MGYDERTTTDDTEPSVDELRAALEKAGAPEELLQALDDPTMAAEIMADLASDTDPLLALMDDWKPLVEDPDCDHLAAELASCEFLGLMRATAPDENQVPELLAGLVDQAEAYGRPESLAMLRAFAVHAPPALRPVAAAAADRLVSAGLTDPPWVDGLGTPTAGACFGQTVPFEAQETVVTTFAYGDDEHAVVVLIDHDLGGGVKDCWLTDRPDQVRAEYEAAGELGLDLAEYRHDQAVVILTKALSNPPCPADEDQTSNVVSYLDLLRQRVQLLGPA